MKARLALKAATEGDHERVDRLFSALDLGELDDYRLFLAAQASAHLPIEAALDAAGAERIVPDWTARRRAGPLRLDLDDLGLQAPAPVAPPPIDDTASILGAVYVLEGSRLGGNLLKRSLPDIAPCRFLDTTELSRSWRKLLELLDHFLYETAQIESAARTARQVFQCFEVGGHRILDGRLA